MNPERDQRVLDLHAKGHRLRDIAGMVGLSIYRIHQIVQKERFERQESSQWPIWITSLGRLPIRAIKVLLESGLTPEKISAMSENELYNFLRRQPGCGEKTTKLLVAALPK